MGYNYFSNLNTAVILFLLVPLVLILSVEWNVIVSSRVSDVRVAQQVGYLVVFPLFGIYVAGELDLIALSDINSLLTIAGILVVADLVLLFMAKAAFRREEILTKWK